jgi:hypothetical protein
MKIRVVTSIILFGLFLGLISPFIMKNCLLSNNFSSYYKDSDANCSQNYFFEDKLSRILSSTEYIHNLNLTGKNTTIAFIDTGINLAHESFARFNGSIPYHLVQLNNTNNQTLNSSPSDFMGHGTHVVSIALGNSSTFRGIAPEAECIMVNVFENNDSFSTSRNHLVQGLLWVLNYSQTHPIDVVSISVGAPSSSIETDLIASIVKNFTDRNIPVVASVGNAGLAGEGSVYTPGSSPFAISVGAYNYSNGKTVDTNGRGPGYNQTIKPDFLAPGTLELGADAQNTSNYVKITGASQAVPYISGLLALLQQYCKENSLTLSPEMLKFLMILTASPLDSKAAFTPTNHLGWGIPQLAPLIAFLQYNNTNYPIEITPKLDFSLENRFANNKIISIRVGISGNYRIHLKSDQVSFAITNISPNSFGFPIILSFSDGTSNIKVNLNANQTYYLVLKGERNSTDQRIVVQSEYLTILNILTIYDLIWIISLGSCVIVVIWFISRKKISRRV